MNFMEFTETHDGRKILVSLDQVIAFSPHGEDATSLNVRDNWAVEVVGKYAEIVQKIMAAQNAPKS